MAGLSERDFQRQVTDLCDWLGLKWYHNPDSRRSNAGFPDLVIAGPGGALLAELKTEKGRVSPAQKEWHSMLAQAGWEVHLWRPGDLPYLKVRLHRLAGK